MLGTMPVSRFLSEYWQKRPVLLRGVMGAAFDPISRAELQELAVSDDADSRLLLTGEWPPEVYHGPFDAEDFRDLPAEDWTVLVQEVDRLSPGMARVLDQFRFVSNWRVDDAMVSFAAPGGGVGPHTDQYDVFLIQGQGRRRWDICTTPIPNPVWREDSDVAVLAEFEADASWELEPGDVLYLPPHIAHDGVSLEPSITISIGFRAPSPLELLEAAAGYAGEEGLGAARYLDPSPLRAEDPGLLSADTLSDLRSQVRKLLDDDATLDRWIAQRLTEAMRGRTGAADSAELTEGRLRASSASQIVYYREDDHLVLVASGTAYRVDSSEAGAISRLTGPDGLDPAEVVDEALRELLGRLCDEGVLRYS
jgi:50S ribosomal protein L16 3-hydroxylase